METPCLIIRGEAKARPGSKYASYVCVGAGKPFPECRDALIFPQFEHIRIKGLSRSPSGRYLVQLKGVARRRVAAGAVIVAGGQPIYPSRVGYGIARRPIPPGSYRARGGLFREHSLPGVLSVSPAGSGYRISASADLPLLPGGRYRLTPASDDDGDARRLPFELLVCLPWEVSRREQAWMGAALEAIGAELSMSRIAAANLRVLGWVAVPGALRRPEVLAGAGAIGPKGEGFDVDASLEILGAGTRFFVARAKFEELARAVEKSVRRSTGAKAGKVAWECGYPPDLVDAVIAQLAKAGRIVRDGGLLLPSGGQAGLSPIERGVLDTLRQRMPAEGLVRAGKGVERHVLEKLVTLRLAVQVGERYCAADSFEELTKRLLRGRNPGEPLDVREAREVLGLPREQVIEVLELLDRRGILRREQDLHRVVRGIGEVN